MDPEWVLLGIVIVGGTSGPILLVTGNPSLAAIGIVLEFIALHAGLKLVKKEVEE